MPAEAPAVAPGSRGLMYGDGCFETFCSYKGGLLHPEAHMERLKAGLEFLGMKYPEPLRRDHLMRLIGRLLHENELSGTDAVLRLQVWRRGERGYASRCEDTEFALTATPLRGRSPAYHLVTVPTRCIPSEALPAIYKFTNGINYIRAGNEARRKGADDALMQTVDGWVAETTVANIFWKRQGVVYTPSKECDILPGTTRRVILELLGDSLGCRVKEGRYPLEELKQAGQVWICNSVMEIAAVKQLDEVTFDAPSTFVDKLKEAFVNYRDNQLLQIE